MNPNEEYSPNPELTEDITPRPEPAAAQEPVYTPAQEPVYTPPVQEQRAPLSGAYHNVGAGQKESPFANSPYYAAHEPRPAYQPQPQAQPQPKPKKVKKQRKPMGCGAKRVLAAVLALVVLAAGCGITASVVNARWEQELAAMEQDVENRINALEQKLQTDSAVQTVISGGSLTPSQVYSMNVNSVVSVVSEVPSAYGYGTSTSTGSGFILTEDGYIITNHHVIEGGGQLTVTTYMGDEYPATLVGSDDVNDVALLKVEATGLDAVELGSSDALMVGDQVVAIGNALGELTATQTVGYISAKDRAVTTDGSIINMLQTDAAINSGNSGGPLFNMKGQVVGITTAKYSGSSSSGASIEGIGFAIPIDDVQGMIGDFREYGYLKNQAYLGVVVEQMDTATAERYSLPAGSYVRSVTEGGSAHRAGIQPKDIIIAVGEYDVTGNAELTSALRRFKAGDTTTITVFRAGQELVLDITFDERPQNVSVDSTDPTLPGEMPQDGGVDSWYDFIAPFIGRG